MEYVKTLKSVHRADKDAVGERAVDLAVLLEKDLQVPLSFVISNLAFEGFVTHNKLQQKIAEALTGKDANRVYERVRELLINGDFPEDMVSEIVEAYESLGVSIDDSLNDIVKAGETPFVTVALSPNHTLPSESKEGIILNVRGLEELLLAVKECWACLFTPSMQRYRQEAGMDNRNLNIGVIVQHMPRGDISAEAWSATGSDTEHLTVKTYYGALDIGVEIEKDEFRLTREYLKPVYHSVAIQTAMLARDEEEKLGKAPLGTRGEEQKLNDKIIIELGRLAKKASQVLDSHVKIVYNVEGETIKTLLATRLLLTKGAVKLQGYEAEERIEEAPVETPTEEPAAPPEEVEAVGERTEIVEEETTVAVDEETGEEEVVAQMSEELTAPTEATVETEMPEPPIEEVPEEAEPAPEEPALEPVAEGEPPVTPELSEEPEPEEPVEEAEDESIFADVAGPAEEPDEPEESAPVEAEETVEVAAEVVEPVEETEEVVEELEAEEVEPVAEEPAEPASDDPAEILEPEPEGAHTEVETEETVVAVDEETGEEEVVSEDHEVADMEPPSQYTFDEALNYVREALTERYEKRFRHQPPSDLKDLYDELSSEVIIPHEELIGRLVTTEEFEQELQDELLGIIDDFLEQIR